jgi:hypothetical protein
MNRVSIMVVLALLIGLVAILSVSLASVRALAENPVVNVVGYTYNGASYSDTSGTIPVGATIHFEVVCDPFTTTALGLAYGDGTPREYSSNYASGIVHFYHTYQTPAIYMAVAFMTTSSGTYKGFSSPITIDGGGSAPNGEGGFLAGIPGVYIGIAAVVGGGVLGAALIAYAKASEKSLGTIEPAYTEDSDTVYLGNATTPQLLRSPEAEKAEEAKVHAKECFNLKARLDDERRQANFAADMVTHSRELLADSLQKLPYEYLKEFVKDKVKDGVTEIPITIIMALIGVEEFKVLAEIFKKVAKHLVDNGDPGVLEQLLRSYWNYIDACNYAKFRQEWADFWLVEFKSRCPGFPA